MKIKLLDLFSGVGGFRLGLEQAGFEITSEQFSEIDKYAISVYQKQFPEAEYVGSVTDISGQPGQADVITFGSPCQDFSLAGKRAGMAGERSSLISHALRLISEVRPKFFIWENVKGVFSSNAGADFWAIIKAFADIGGYRLEWQLLNTSWFLPQNRERIYLVGCLGEGSGRAILPIASKSESDSDLSGQQANTNTILQRYGNEGQGSFIVERELATQVGTWRTHKDGEGFREVESGNCPTIPARAREDGSGQPVIRITEPTSKGYTEAGEGDSINFSQPSSKTRRGRVGVGVAQTLDTACNQGTPKQGRIRRLTPIECERLQGFPDNWTQYGHEGQEISDTQRYKMMGNAVSVPVVKAVGENILLSIEK